MNKKPNKTIVNCFNCNEMNKFKESKNFPTYKNKAHFYFDKIWKHNLLTRDEAYEWLAKKLDLTREQAHFSLLDNNQCEEAIFFCQQILNDIRRLDLDFGDEPSTPFYILEDNFTE